MPRRFFVAMFWTMIAWALHAIPALAQQTAPAASPKKDALGRLQRVGDRAGFATGAENIGLSFYIGRVIQAALALVGTIFLAQMVWAGYLWMTAAGEEDQITKAKNIIRRSIVGVAIVLSAWAITWAVVFRLIAASGYGGSAIP